MTFLHPVYSVLFLFLLLMSINEFRLYGENRNKTIFWLVGIYLVIITGFRYQVGADYPIYEQMYNMYFPNFVEYEDIFSKAIFRKTILEIEWIYTLINKFMFHSGLPFFAFTVFSVTLAISLKFKTIFENTTLPVLGLILYFMPSHFFEESGHMRQGLGMAFCIFSFKYIKERNLILFLLFIFIALGFHKSSIIFLPAYWLVLIPLTSNQIWKIVLVGIILSPFQIYSYFGTFSDSISFTPQDISDGFEGYIDLEHTDISNRLGFQDVLLLGYTFLLVIYNRVSCEQIYYYEYMRNLGVMGIFLYFIFRGNPIFSTRLIGVYIYFVTIFCIPNIIYSINNRFTQKLVFTGLILFIIFYYFTFSTYQAFAGSFVPERYRNILWSL